MPQETSPDSPVAAADLEHVDVAIVMESTYPYLKGGVSAVVHDIVMGNQDLTFGVIHIMWDSGSPSEDLYGVPHNVRWIHPVRLSMQEHRTDFMALTPRLLGMRPSARRALAERLYDAFEAVVDRGDPDPLWSLYDEGMNPRTQRFPLWALLGTKEFMEATRERLPGLEMSLVDTFWTMREFFSLAYAVLGADIPRAAVYHAHTTGYAALLGAAGARQNDGRFFLTEHNLYVRDTVNTLLERNMALRLTANDYRTFDVSPRERAWMAWWTEMARFTYPSAEVISYLYPKAITEAADLGAPVERSVIIPNGMVVREFEDVSRRRAEALPGIRQDADRLWRLVYIARVVPIKGLADLIESVQLLVGRGVTNFVVDVLGPTDHTPDYYMHCREKMKSLGVEDYFVFRGTVNVREMLGDFDVLVLPSHNEGQPIVVLEAMTAGIPTVGTEVGGMAQLIDDPLTTSGGRTWGPAGLLVDPDDVEDMTRSLQRIMADPHLYEELAVNARGRVSAFFQLEDAMGAYNRVYKELAGIAENVLEESQGAVAAGPDGTRVIDLTVFDDTSPSSSTPGNHRAAGSD